MGFDGGLFVLLKSKALAVLHVLTEKIKLLVVMFNVVSGRRILSGWWILHEHLLGLE